MMKMDGQDSVECQNWEKRDIMVIFELFKLDNKTNNEWCCLLKMLKRNKTWERRPVAKNGVFREMMSTFSLEV